MAHASGTILVESGGVTAGQATDVAVNLTIGLSSMVPTPFVLHALLAGRFQIHQESAPFKMGIVTGHVSQRFIASGQVSKCPVHFYPVQKNA